MRKFWRIIAGDFGLFQSPDAQSWVRLATYRRWNIKKALKFWKWIYDECDSEVFTEITDRTGKMIFFGKRNLDSLKRAVNKK